MKNKFLAIVMLVLMVSLVLVACDNSNDTDSSISQHIHSFGSWEITTSPTCKNKGMQTRFCNCGETQSSTIPFTDHSWLEATCEAPMTCSVCQITYGIALEHIWEDATCDTPKTCSICNSINGSPLGHNWQDATCTSKTCSQCGKTEENVGKHIDSGNGTCKYCEQDILLLNLQEGFDVNLIISTVGGMNYYCTVKYTNTTEYAILFDYNFVYANGKGIYNDFDSYTLDSGHTDTITYYRAVSPYDRYDPKYRDMYLDNNSLAWTKVSINGKTIYVRFGVNGSVAFGYSSADIGVY